MNVLIVSKYFTPHRSARALQVKKLADALHKAGANVLVIAGMTNPSHVPANTPYAVHYVPYKDPVPFQRIRNVLRATLWILRACGTAGKSNQRFRADIMLTVSVPVEAHIVGFICRFLNKIAWCMYFSDPWPKSIMPAVYRHRKVKCLRNVELYFLSVCLRKASGIIAPTRYLIRWIEKYTRVPIAHKSTAIPHIGTMPAADAIVDVDKMVHIGDVYKRISKPLLAACRRARQETANRFRRLQFIGANSQELRPAIAETKTQAIVTTHAMVSAEKAAAIAASANVLLVIEADGLYVSPFLPSKFADYAMTGRPILAITPPVSAIRDCLTQYGGGVAVTHNTDRITEAIIKLFGPRDPRMFRPAELGGVFDESSVARQYLAFFSEHRDPVATG